MHRTAFALAAILLAPAVLAGCATAPDQAMAEEDMDGRDCFHIDSISGFGIVDRDTISVRVGPSREYEIDASRAGCINLRWANTIAITSRPSSFLCVGDGASVSAHIITDQGERCLVTAVRRAPEEPAEEEPEGSDGSRESGDEADGSAS